ncbi:SGNH/GDSL hydrolase family protein [soil metagenome]
MVKLFALIGLLALTPMAARASGPDWIATWGASPAPPLTPSATAPPALAFEDQTLVQVVRLSAGGRRLRLRLSNAYGSAPLQIGAVRVALLDAGGLATGDRAVTFSGAPTVTIPVGAPLLSDAIDLKTGPLAKLRVAIYLPGKVALCTCHMSGGETALVSPPGDYTQRPIPPTAGKSPKTFRAFLTGVEVQGAMKGPVIVAFGDSITEGYLSTNDADRRWPDRLAERLAARGHAAVVNAGIGGNRILADGSVPIFGVSALARFDRDALAIPGATHLILLEGVNDIGSAGATPPTAQALIAGFRQMIVRAHDRGLKVIGGTILPYEGANYFKPVGEAVRQAVNAWIRAGGEFDGVIDFDAAIRDPANPSRMRAELQSGDWLHPNDAGYRVMGDAVNLKLFAGR